MPEITPEELQRVREWCRTYGPANCWTGTTGSVAAIVLNLLAFYEQAKRETVRDRGGDETTRKLGGNRA